VYARNVPKSVNLQLILCVTVSDEYEGFVTVYFKILFQYYPVARKENHEKPSCFTTPSFQTTLQTQNLLQIKKTQHCYIIIKLYEKYVSDVFKATSCK
jgi:hypothetical protein